MRLAKISTLSLLIGLFFFGVSYATASRLEESKSYSYPESIARHYAQVSGSVFEGSMQDGKIAEFKKTIPVDAASPFEKIEIESTAVDVELSASPTDEIQIELASRRVDPKEPVLVDTRGRTLRLLVQEKTRDLTQRRMWMSFNFDDSSAPVRKNTLNVRLPKAILNAQVQTVSGDARVSTTLQNLHFQSKSGDIRIATLANPMARVTNLSVETVSGDLKGSGRFDQLRFNSVSGDLNLTSFDRVLSIDAKTVSGDVEIKSLEPVDAEFAFSTKSGKLEFDKDLRMPQPALTKNGEQTLFKIGKGTSKVQFQTTSGDLKIDKADHEDLQDDDDNDDDDHDTASNFLECAARVALLESVKIGNGSLARCVRASA